MSRGYRADRVDGRAVPSRWSPVGVGIRSVDATGIEERLGSCHGAHYRRLLRSIGRADTGVNSIR